MTMSDTTLRDRTAHHYDDHPFDAITAEDERQARNIQPKAFIEFCDQYSQKQMAVAEVGCGAGGGTMFLRASGADVTAVDISAVSSGAVTISTSTPMRGHQYDGWRNHPQDARCSP